MKMLWGLLFTMNAFAFEIHGHRGYWDRTENTMHSFVRAVQKGADIIELDLHATSDNKVIVYHDPYIRENLCLGAGGKVLKPEARVFVRNITFAQVRTYDCGVLHSNGQTVFPGERIPLMSEIFAGLDKVRTLKGNLVGLNIEVKYYDNNPQWYPPRDQYAELVAQEIRASRWDVSRMIVQSFDAEILKMIKAKVPGLSIALLLNETNEAVRLATSIGAKTVTPDHSKLTRERVAELRAAGLRVIPWTVNSADRILELRSWGVDGVITDYADRALPLVGAK